MVSQCEECGRKFGIRYKKHKTSDGKTLCYECFDKVKSEEEWKESKVEDEKEVKGVSRQLGKEEIETKNQIEKKEYASYGDVTQVILYFAGVFSTLICIITGLNMISLRSVAGNTVAEAYYNSVGVFVIGIGLFVGPLLWGIACLIKKK